MCTFGEMLESTLDGQDRKGMPQHLCYDPGSKTKDRKGLDTTIIFQTMPLIMEGLIMIPTS